MILSLRGTVIQVGLGTIVVSFNDGDHIAELPCSEEAQQWAGAQLYEDMVLRVDIDPAPGEVVG